MNGFFSGLLGGVSDGVVQARKRQQETERQDLLNKLAKIQGQQTELSMKLQMDEAAREQKKQGQADQFYGGIGGQSGGGILDMISNPEMLRAGLASGALDVTDIIKMQEAQQGGAWTPEAVQQLMSGGQMGGMGVEGATFGENGARVRFGREPTSVIMQTMPDGSQRPLIVGRESGGVRPAGVASSGGLGAAPPALGGAAAGGFMTSPPDSAKPVGLDVARKVRMPDGSIADPRISMDDIMAAGGRILSDDEVAAEFATKGAEAVLTEMDGLIDKVFKSNDLPGRLADSITNKYQNVMQEDPNFSLYTSLASGSLSSVIRAMGEKGALAEGDVQRALNLVPKTGPIPDSRKVAKGKINQIRSILEKAKGRAAAPKAGVQPGAVMDGYEYTGGDPADQRNWRPVQ